MKTTIKDVAKLAGVSFKTVSRVVNHEPNVAPKLQEQVWAAVKELNYQPNRSARLLRGTASSLGLIYDNPNSHYIIELQNGILKECHKHGFELIIHPCEATSKDIVSEILSMTQRSQVAGLVLTPPLSEMPEVIDQLQQAGVVLVRIISAQQADTISSCVFIDDHQAAYQITQHLIDLGHKDIAFLGGNIDHRSSLERKDGYLKALRDNKLDVQADLILDGQYSFQSGVAKSEILLQQDNRPSAIFACNDEIAAGTLFTARRLGLEVPSDLSIAGFEDSPFSRQSWPQLTTSQQAGQEIAQKAAGILIDEIRQRKKSKQGYAWQGYGFCPQLLERDSTGPKTPS